MKKLILICVLAAFGSACTDDDLTSTLTVSNNSSYTIDEIYLSAVGSADWGADLLGAELLEPGDELQVGGIECDDYDVRIIDEDGDECVLSNIDLCLENAAWNITDVELAICAAFAAD